MSKPALAAPPASRIFAQADSPVGEQGTSARPVGRNGLEQASLPAILAARLTDHRDLQLVSAAWHLDPTVEFDRSWLRKRADMLGITRERVRQLLRRAEQWIWQDAERGEIPIPLPLESRQHFERLRNPAFVPQSVSEAILAIVVRLLPPRDAAVCAIGLEGCEEVCGTLDPNRRMRANRFGLTTDEFDRVQMAGMRAVAAVLQVAAEYVVRSTGNGLSAVHSSGRANGSQRSHMSSLRGIMAGASDNVLRTLTPDLLVPIMGPYAALMAIHRTAFGDETSRTGIVTLEQWRQTCEALGVVVGEQTHLHLDRFIACAPSSRIAWAWDRSLQCWVAPTADAQATASRLRAALEATHSLLYTGLMFHGFSRLEQVRAMAPLGVAHALRTRPITAGVPAVLSDKERSSSVGVVRSSGAVICERGAYLTLFGVALPLHEEVALALGACGPLHKSHLPHIARAADYRRNATERGFPDVSQYPTLAEVLIEILARDPQRRFVVDKGCVSLAPTATVTYPDGALRVLLDTMRRVGEATSGELCEAVGRAGYPPESAIPRLRSCSFIERGGYGRYRLRGIATSANDAQAEEQSYRPRQRRGVSSRDSVQVVTAQGDNDLSLHLQVTSDAMRGTVRIPHSVPLDDGVWTCTEPALDGHHSLVLTAGRLRGFTPVLKALGLKRGARVTARFDLTRMTVAFRVSRGRPLAPPRIRRLRDLSHAQRERLASEITESVAEQGPRPLVGLLRESRDAK